ncbi:uncharacterized protein RCO7_04966 [Rhynchosporium graminicola]|uniref:Uncharacterized protein n=1 Tax=Rhynchosporium graminicola TaxID=2792576 RepID=A0A1E1KE14_9HELO|nr:uncharacterized protein RCO7_04966 [Rhynchosporium commune]
MHQHRTFQEEGKTAIVPKNHAKVSNVSNSSSSGSPAYPQMLQFVSIGPGGSVTNPNMVRSHAIKGYHQRRKEAKKAYLNTLNQQRNVQLRPIGIAPRPNALGLTEKSKTSAGSSVASRESSSGWKEDEDVVATMGKQKEYESLEAAVEAEIIRQEDMQLCLLATIDSQANNLVPYAWFEKDGPVLSINRTKWPFPSPFEVTGSDRTDQVMRSLTPRQSAWMPYTRSPDFTVVKGAVLDPVVLSWIGQSPECFKFRVETIKWIQEQVRDPKKAFSYATIGAIMTFTMWTAGSGDSNEMSTHMDAVQRIIDARGGFISFHRDGPMVAKLTLFDSMIAVLTGQASRFPQVDYYLSFPPPPPTTTQITLIHDSPLSGDGVFDNIIIRDIEDAESIISLLKKMWLLTLDHRLMTLAEESTTSRPQIHFSVEPQHKYNTHLLTLPLLSSCHDLSHHHVLETLIHTSTIYREALTYPATDFMSPYNQTTFQSLTTAFAKSSHDDFWIRYPGIQLWVLLVGTAASRGRKEAPFWMFYLSRTGSFSNAQNWLTGNAAIRLFLDIQRRMRDGRVRM